MPTIEQRYQFAADARRRTKDRRRARSHKTEDTACAHWCGKNYYGPKQPEAWQLKEYSAANGWEPDWGENAHGDQEILGWRRLLGTEDEYGYWAEGEEPASPIGVDQL